MKMFALTTIASALGLSACAQLQFGVGSANDAITFFDPVPYLVVSYNKECEASASILTLPDPTKKRHVKPRSGFGTADLTASFSNGLLTQFGQKTDTKIPESIPQVLSILKQFGFTAAEQSRDCKPGKQPEMHRILSVDGKIVFDPPLTSAP